MPKILINEVDKTSAGTPGRYGNYSVLITGYQKAYSETDTASLASYKKSLEDYKNKVTETKPRLSELTEGAKVLKAREELAIAEGVYELNSIADFKALTGYSDEDMQKPNIVEHSSGEKHYGNKMAYELLKLGYQVIYKVIDKISDMSDFTKCWEIFKDKATFDFRFVSHGLLESCYDKADYDLLKSKITKMQADLEVLSQIEEDAEVADKEQFSVSDLHKCDEKFAEFKSKGNFSDTTLYTVAFASYSAAAGWTLPDGVDLSDPTAFGGLSDEVKAQACTPNPNAGIKKYLAEAQADFEELCSCQVTNETFNSINYNIAQLASYKMDKDAITTLNGGRGDCTALIELDETTYVATDSDDTPESRIIKEMKVLGEKIVCGTNGAYCALTVPSVYYASGMKMPGAFHYLACFMNSLSSGFAEWYAAAGYNRGVASATIDHTSVTLGEIAINALEPRYITDQSSQPPFACNVIAKFRGSYYLWGNRTAAQLGEFDAGEDLTAEHFLNIRQLSTTLKKQLYVACRRFTFDPNSDTLWFNFVNAITPTLNAMKADQGIRDYKIVKVFTDKKATLKAKIRIIPIEAVEDFDITVSLEDSFGDVSVTAEG